MLHILWLFVKNAEKEPLQELWALFAEKLKPHTMNDIKSHVKWCSDIDVIPFKDQMFMLDQLNEMRTALDGGKQIITSSALIECVKFDDCLILVRVLSINIHKHMKS